MQSSTNETPGSFDLQSIYQDALKKLQLMRDQGKITSANYDLIANTKDPAEIEGVVTASQAQPETTKRALKVVRPLLEQLKRFGPALDVFAGAALPQSMGVNFLGLVWGSIKFFMVVSVIQFLRRSAVQLINDRSSRMFLTHSPPFAISLSKSKTAFRSTKSI